MIFIILIISCAIAVLFFAVRYKRNKFGIISTFAGGKGIVQTNVTLGTSSIQKISGITIKGIKLETEINQPDEVLVIILKIDSGITNQIYEDADYEIISGNVTFPEEDDSYTFLENKIMNALNAETKGYKQFNISFSKYKTGFPNGNHEPVVGTISAIIKHELSFSELIY